MFSPQVVFTYLMVLCRTYVYVYLQTVCGLLGCDTVPFGRYIRAFSEEHTGYTLRVEVKVKVKQSRYRPGVAQRVPGS